MNVDNIANIKITISFIKVGHLKDCENTEKLGDLNLTNEIPTDIMIAGISTNSIPCIGFFLPNLI